MVIDFHTHVFEKRQAQRVVEDVLERAQVPAFSDGTLPGLVRSMDQAGIDISVISRITTRPNQVDTVNAWLQSLQSPRTPALCTTHPGLPEWCDQVPLLRDQGFRGFKVHPDYQGFFVDERRMFPFYEAVAAEDMCILFHAGLDRGLPGFPVHATPAGLLRVHRAFPRLRMIAAHMGGEHAYDEVEAHLVGEDVYLDTSFVLRKMGVHTLRRLVRKHSAERIVFGTDSPWIDQGEDLRYLRNLPFLSTAALEQIGWRNAAELLQLGEAAPTGSRAGGSL